MDAGELVKLFRNDVVDDVPPYFWDDNEAYEYANDAYVMFSRLTGGVSDATSAVTQIPIVATERDAAISPKIMRVREAWLASTNEKIKVINAQDVDSLTDMDYGVLRQINNVTTSGPVRYMILGLENELVRWVRVPEANDTLQMVVERLPLTRVENGNHQLDDVREEHHFHLLKWMRHLAYRKQDTDRFDLIKSDQERDDFYAYCAMAQNEKDVRRHKVRVVAYGGL